MREKGFTLAEILVALGITILLSWTITTFGKDVLSLNQSISQGLTAELDGRRALKIMMIEIRSANQSAQGTYPIESVATSSLIFFTDIDNDGVTERVRYFLDSGIIKRGETRASGSPLAYSQTEVVSTLAESILSTSTPIFDYYDSNYAGTSTPMTMPVNINNIRLIRATLFIDKDPNRSPVPLSLTSQTSLRNLKNNL